MTDFVSELSADGKLRFLANYLEVITKSIYTRFTNCGSLGMLRDFESGGEVCGALAKQTI